MSWRFSFVLQLIIMSAMAWEGLASMGRRYRMRKTPGGGRLQRWKAKWSEESERSRKVEKVKIEEEKQKCKPRVQPTPLKVRACLSIKHLLLENKRIRLVRQAVTKHHTQLHPA